MTHNDRSLIARAKHLPDYRDVHGLIGYADTSEGRHTLTKIRNHLYEIKTGVP